MFFMMILVIVCSTCVPVILKENPYADSHPIDLVSFQLGNVTHTIG